MIESDQAEMSDLLTAYTADDCTKLGIDNEYVCNSYRLGKQIDDDQNNNNCKRFHLNEKDCKNYYLSLGFKRQQELEQQLWEKQQEAIREKFNPENLCLSATRGAKSHTAMGDIVTVQWALIAVVSLLLVLRCIALIFPCFRFNEKLWKTTKQYHCLQMRGIHTEGRVSHIRFQDTSDAVGEYHMTVNYTVANNNESFTTEITERGMEWSNTNRVTLVVDPENPELVPPLTLHDFHKGHPLKPRILLGACLVLVIYPVFLVGHIRDLNHSEDGCQKEIARRTLKLVALGAFLVPVVALVLFVAKNFFQGKRGISHRGYNQQAGTTETELVPLFGVLETEQPGTGDELTATLSSSDDGSERRFYPSFGPNLIGGFLTPKTFRAQLAAAFFALFLLISAVCWVDEEIDVFPLLFSCAPLAAIVAVQWRRHNRNVRTMLEKINMSPGTQRFLSTLHAFLENRRRMDSAAHDVDPLGLLQKLEIQCDSNGIENDDGTFKTEYQQQNRQGRPVQDLSELYDAANQAFKAFRDFLRLAILPHIDGLDLESSLKIAPLKSPVRASEKALDDYSGRIPGPGESWLYDIVRGSLTCESEPQVRNVVALLHEKAHIVKAKNRFRKPECNGYRDMIFHIRLPIVEQGGGTPFYHICELQIHVATLNQLAKEISSHTYYEYFRTYFEGSKSGVADRMRDLIMIAGASKLEEAFIAELVMSSEKPRLRRLAALFQDHLGEAGLALLLWEQLLFLKEKEKSNTHRGWGQYAAVDGEKARILFKMGGAYLAKGECNLALSSYVGSLVEWKKSNIGIRHQYGYIAYLSIAHILSNQGKYKTALLFLQNGFSVQKFVLGSGSKHNIELATTHRQLASLNCRLDQMEEAFFHYMAAHHIQKEVLGFDHPHTALTRDNIIAISKRVGNNGDGTITSVV